MKGKSRRKRKKFKIIKKDNQEGKEKKNNGRENGRKTKYGENKKGSD